jgi:hypothetical protein
MARVVWIVGAGFSAPLGGPTLADLFSEHAYRHLEAIYPSGDGPLGEARKVVLGNAAVVARRLYLVGARQDRGSIHPGDRERVGHRGMWDDAEGFLDTMETAADAPTGALARRLKRVADSLMSPNDAPPLLELRDAARRMLAVECSKFLLETDPKSERWEPYRTWRDVLRSGNDEHTVVTFNYDLVLETLGLDDWVRLPATASDRGSCILKLHGSVNWRKARDGFGVETDPHFVATCPVEQLAIAPPGPSKSTIAQDFEPLWKVAEQRLQQANSVFFVGYRFPPTDATARRRILMAIPGARCGLNIVLGPSDPNGDIARLRGLLKFRAPDVEARVHPMWAQDFLSVLPTGLFTPV